MRIGVVADTHGLVRPALLELLRGCEVILHAGDVGRDVNEALLRIAPLRVVQGNNDPSSVGPIYLDLTLGGVRVALTHGHTFSVVNKARVLAAEFPGAQIIIYGHTHRPTREEIIRPSGLACVVVNPGAAGPRRFGSRGKASAAILSTDAGTFTWTLHYLEP